MARYQVFPIADENCATLDERHLLAETDDQTEAKSLAEGHSNQQWGAGILDATTGQIDVGFGFGVACPDVE